ncbi:hypothetical protein KAT92_00080 [Candidatus Babeliales bacterium]|nr:hypothetical protein [Candidatus Babeliales bacterium]
MKTRFLSLTFVASLIFSQNLVAMEVDPESTPQEEIVKIRGHQDDSTELAETALSISGHVADLCDLLAARSSEKKDTKRTYQDFIEGKKWGEVRFDNIRQNILSLLFELLNAISQQKSYTTENIHDFLNSKNATQHNLIQLVYASDYLMTAEDITKAIEDLLVKNLGNNVADDLAILGIEDPNYSHIQTKVLKYISSRRYKIEDNSKIGEMFERANSVLGENGVESATFRQTINFLSAVSLRNRNEQNAFAFGIQHKPEYQNLIHHMCFTRCSEDAINNAITDKNEELASKLLKESLNHIQSRFPMLYYTGPSFTNALDPSNHYDFDPKVIFQRTKTLLEIRELLKEGHTPSWNSLLLEEETYYCNGKYVSEVSMSLCDRALRKVLNFIFQHKYKKSDEWETCDRTGLSMMKHIYLTLEQLFLHYSIDSDNLLREQLQRFLLSEDHTKKTPMCCDEHETFYIICKEQRIFLLERLLKSITSPNDMPEENKNFVIELINAYLLEETPDLPINKINFIENVFSDKFMREQISNWPQIIKNIVSSCNFLDVRVSTPKFLLKNSTLEYISDEDLVKAIKCIFTNDRFLSWESYSNQINFLTDALKKLPLLKNYETFKEIFLNDEYYFSNRKRPRVNAMLILACAMIKSGIVDTNEEFFNGFFEDIYPKLNQNKYKKEKKWAWQARCLYGSTYGPERDATSRYIPIYLTNEKALFAEKLLEAYHNDNYYLDTTAPFVAHLLQEDQGFNIDKLLRIARGY